MDEFCIKAKGIFITVDHYININIIETQTDSPMMKSKPNLENISKILALETDKLISRVVSFREAMIFFLR